MTDPRIKVFISYSHDSKDHSEFVFGLAERLRKDGLVCVIDLHINGSPSEGWQRWMENQIETADFVLLVCTETYLRRYRGHETDESKGKGVTFEGVVISESLYDAYYRNVKFVPVLPEGGDPNHVPLPLKSFTAYTLNEQYEKLYRFLTGQPEYVASPVGNIRVMPLAQTAFGDASNQENPSKPPSPDKIQITKLPYTNSHLFGREKELDMMDDAWNEGVKILVLKAMGGTGKTALLKHWLDQFVVDDFRGAQAVFTWSFYSQGSAENKQTSTDDFFESALRFFGYTDEALPAPHERGIKLARLVAAHRTLLILDGLEPLQHPVGIFRGELKDQSLKALLQQLAANNAGLCLISSRQTVEELKGKPEKLVLAHDLEQLQEKDGVALLQSIGVKGSDAELRQAVNEVAGHALALNLLGNYIKTVLNGDIRQRDKIPGLMAERNDGKHAEKMLAAYEAHLQGSPGLSVLYLLGLFDRPISPGAVLCLKQAKIPALTDQLGSDADWCYAIADLREQSLLNAMNTDYPDNLDCHPLIREYFAKQLKTQRSQAWQQAHTRLYYYYKALPEKYTPDKLEEMQPLFSAAAHGCAAGLHQRVIAEIYCPRIQRDWMTNYLSSTLGAFSDDLAVVAHFFTIPWQEPVASLSDDAKAGVLNWAGVRLNALGRLGEAVEPMRESLELSVQLEKWIEAAKGATNLSLLQLTLGDITLALNSAMKSAEYADKAGNMFYRIRFYSTHAYVLHQAGQETLARELFQVAEAFLKEDEPNFPCLYSLPGFYYSELLLAQGETTAVLKRCRQWMEWYAHDDPLLDKSLIFLVGGWAHLQKALEETLQNPILPNETLTQATNCLNQAVAGLRVAGHQDQLPLGLLARASLFRHTDNFTRARQDLQEVFDIAEPSGMRLFLTDYHLEMARLLLEESKALNPSLDTPKAPTSISTPESMLNLQDHITQARALITATGYHRRDVELAELEAESRFRELAIHGDKQRGQELSDKLKNHYGDTSSS